MIASAALTFSRRTCIASLVLLAACATDGGQAARDTPAYQREGTAPLEQAESSKRAAIRLQLAIGYYQQRQMEVALNEIKQALAADPNYADAYSVRALIYMEMRETSLADESFQQALRLSPGNPDFLNNYGWFLCQNNQEAKAIVNFEAALQNRAYQAPGKALANAGICSLRVNDIDAAERYLLRAFQYEPGNPLVNLNLAEIYYRRGNNDRARFYTNRIVRFESATAEMFWLGIKVERRLGDRAAEESLVTQLRRRFPDSPQFAAYQRGAFNE